MRQAVPDVETQAFDPTRYTRFRFCSYELDRTGRVTLRYALDDEIAFVEQFDVPVPAPLDDEVIAGAEALVWLLHLVAGVSYFKTAVPPRVEVETAAPGPAAGALLEALYSLGLAEFAFRAGLPALPRPAFPRGPGVAAAKGTASARSLVPVGGGKDSVVALEAVRGAGHDLELFSVGDAEPIRATAEIAGLPRLIARRRLDPALGELNRRGALNGHVPVTAIVSCAALLTAHLNGRGRAVMANERSASRGNVAWEGVDVNHQFSKGLEAERLLRAALAEVAPHLEYLSVLRPASELAIARAFARLPAYHHAFTSCNAVFRIDLSRRAGTWCRDCPKCRFVFLALAPWLPPDQLSAIFGANLLDDPDQYEGFALLGAVGGHKPFECVGEEEESVAAFRLLADHPDWRDAAVVARFRDEALPAVPPGLGDPDAVLALASDHEVPDDLLAAVHALLGA